MRVNSRVHTERTDMLGNIQIPNCPSEFRKEAEQIVMMASGLDYSVGEYHSMTELDKILMWDYWKTYDGLPTTASAIIDGLGTWFIHQSTAPEILRRARQWLTQHNYLIVNPDVAERATQAGDNWRKSLKNVGR